MNELTTQQMQILERIVSAEFSVVAFSLYANAIGIRKGDCAALLDAIPAGGFRLFGEPCILVDGNLTVRIAEKGKTWFVWKKKRLEATPERLAALNQFVDELRMFLEPRV